MITINEVELDFSLYCPEDMQRYEAASEALAQALEAMPKAQGDGLAGYVAQLRLGCDAVFEFFEACFGEGAANLIFGNEADLGRCMAAIEAFGKQVRAQAEGFAPAPSKRFVPNRATRKVH